jgi:hypothetical protein
MNRQQLEHIVLQVRNQNGGAYRGKSLCEACLMAKASITVPEDQIELHTIWNQWFTRKLITKGTCVVCGHESETMNLPATQ